MSEPFIGSIYMFAGNFAPRGYALCQGQLLPISQNTALFSILGTTYGGNGQTTFALPDLRGRVPVQQGQGQGLNNVALGEQAGSQQTTLLSNNMPAHSHTLNADNSQISTGDPSNAYAGGTGIGGAQLYAPGPPNTAMGPQAIGIAGGSQPFSIMNPYLGINFIIALEGIFPSRN